MSAYIAKKLGVPSISNDVVNHVRRDKKEHGCASMKEAREMVKAGILKPEEAWIRGKSGHKVRKVKYGKGLDREEIASIVLNKYRDNEIAGGFLMESLKKAMGVVKGVRKDYPPAVRTWLAKNGDKEIKALSIIRTPIQSAINKALNVVSFGAWDKARASKGYDTFYHLGLVAEYEEGKKRAVLEKNAVININNSFNVQANSEYQLVPMRGTVTFRQLLDRANKVMGDDFFLYDAFSNNCQVFIKELLAASGLLTSEAQTFLFQDIGELVKELPGHTGKIARALTDIGALADVAMHGQGLQRAKTQRAIHDRDLQVIVKIVGGALL
jgi:hypothetical protein